MSSKKNIFQNTACLSQEQLIRYVKGELTKAEMRAVELHIADCEICFDAVEGLSLAEKSKLENIQSELQLRIKQKLKTEEHRKVIPLFKKWYSAAAAVLLLFLLSVYLVKNYLNNDNSGLAESKIENTIQTKEPAKQIIDESALRNDTLVSQPHSDNKTFNSELKQTQQTVSKTIESDESKPSPPVEFKSKTEVALNKKMEEPKKESAEITKADKYDDYRNGEAAVAETPVAETKDAETVAQNKPAQADEKVSEKSSKSTLKKTEEKLMNITATPSATSTGATALSQPNSFSTASTFDFNLYDNGINYFNAKDYTHALPVFNQLLAKQTDNISCNYYAGVSNYYLANYTVAIQHLNIVANYKHNSLYESALWFKGNALLKLDNKKEAKKMFEAVVKQKGNYKTQAEELLKGL